MIRQKNEVAQYWQQRYENNNTGWDMGQVSPPLKAYFDQLKHKELRVLIPGAGNAYEAEYLIKKGFTDVHVVDIAQDPLKNIHDRVGEHPALHLHHIDFFEFHGKFDLIIEQTFFCALDPSQRKYFAQKMSNSMKDDARLVGLLFDFPLVDGPPYGGNVREYKEYFSPYFNFHTFQRAHNSYYKRYPKEIFINLVKK